MGQKPEFPLISLEPDPVIEAYKRDVDRTLIRENLNLSILDRIKKMEAAARFAGILRHSRIKPGPR